MKYPEPEWREKERARWRRYKRIKTENLWYMGLNSKGKITNNSQRGKHKNIVQEYKSDTELDAIAMLDPIIREGRKTQ